MTTETLSDMDMIPDNLADDSQPTPADDSYEFTTELDSAVISPVPELDKKHYQNPFLQIESDTDEYLKSIVADSPQWSKYLLILVVISIMALAAVPSTPDYQKMELTTMTIHGNSMAQASNR